MRIITLTLFSLILCVSFAHGGDRLHGQIERHDGFTPLSLGESRDTDSGIPFPQERSRGKLNANEMDLESSFNPYNYDTGPDGIDSITNPDHIEHGTRGIDSWQNPYAIDSGIEIFD